ncbi:hypothetical protein RRG08_032430 [Elysia crispata]|uniref:Uncharacterized protein n=1 Tax=Elysia crispata TaxID=231223 RepID=A0AAE0XP53_9GAST|nr:hypothetical protein RRG08_032430 [Elysia crispata]
MLYASLWSFKASRLRIILGQNEPTKDEMNSQAGLAEQANGLEPGVAVRPVPGTPLVDADGRGSREVWYLYPVLHVLQPSHPAVCGDTVGYPALHGKAVWLVSHSPRTLLRPLGSHLTPLTFTSYSSAILKQLYMERPCGWSLIAPERS